MKNKVNLATPLVCTAAQAAAMALPRSLEMLGLALKLKKQKDIEGKRVMLRVSQPRRPTKADPHSKWHEDPKDLNRVFDYCADDVLSEKEAASRLKPLEGEELRLWHLDQRINSRGVMIDLEGVEAALYLIEEYTKELCAEISEITDGAVTSPGELKRLHTWLEDKGVHLPNLQALTIDECLLHDRAKYPAEAMRVLEIRALLGKASTKKYQSMRDRVCADGRVKDIILYCGASTGRFSGSGIQIQNLPKSQGITDQETCIAIAKLRDLELFKMCYSDVLKALSGIVRGMIIAAPGKILRSFDYNAIEARVILWLAGCETGIKEFRDGLDSYKLMAVEVYGIPVEEIAKDSEERDIGKRTVLGSGFGMGPDKFVVTCWTQGRKVITKELATKAIQAYRKKYHEVPKFWRDLDNAAMRVTLGKPGTTVDVGKLRFIREKDYFNIRLPSGRLLYYWYPSVKEQITDFGPRDAVHFWYVDSQTKRWVEGSGYGGMWAENVTQATARDVMAASMLALDDAGHTIAFTVHDEEVLEDDENFSDMKTIEKLIIDSLPAWAADLPIAVSGWDGKRYKK